MKKTAVALGLALIAAVPAEADFIGNRVELLSATPAGAELTAWCQGTECRQAVADRAQAECRRHNRDAQYVRSTLTERDFAKGERWHFVYNCVR